jgi:hypothetical protein
VLPKVVVETIPTPEPIVAGEDWVASYELCDEVSKPGIIMGAGKALRCKWYKVEFEHFAALYVAEANMRAAEHEAIEEYMVEMHKGLETTWFQENEVWIGGTAGVILGVGMTALIVYALGQ